MRILHLISDLAGGGAERQLSYLAPELARMGHDVHLGYTKDCPYNPNQPGVILHHFKTRSNYDPYLLCQLLRLINRIKPDVIHTWILQMDIAGGIAARLTKTPWIFREPSSGMAYPLIWKNRFRVLVGSGASAIVSNSSGGNEYWKAQLPGSRRYIVANALPVDEIDRTLGALPPTLTKAETPIVLYVGRMIPIKNLKVYLEALARIKQRQNILGVLTGEGSQRSELEMLRHNLGLDEDVLFTGYLPASSVWALMKKASVFVSLSAYEGCPNTVMEAMTCGCPLVVSDIPAHREILDENCAVLVDPSDTQQTTNAIGAALRNANASKARASVAKHKTREWSINEMARNYEQIYNGVV